MDAHLIWKALTSTTPEIDTPTLEESTPTLEESTPTICRQEVLDKLSHIQDLLDNIKSDIEPEDHVFYPHEYNIIESYINDLQNNTQALNAITTQNREV